MANQFPGGFPNVQRLAALAGSNQYGGAPINPFAGGAPAAPRMAGGMPAPAPFNFGGGAPSFIAPSPQQTGLAGLPPGIVQRLNPQNIRMPTFAPPTAPAPIAPMPRSIATLPPGVVAPPLTPGTIRLPPTAAPIVPAPSLASVPPAMQQRLTPGNIQLPGAAPMAAAPSLASLPPGIRTTALQPGIAAPIGVPAAGAPPLIGSMR